MSILLTCVGDTDPIRDLHDGSMLHILRHYSIDIAYVYLSEQMAKKEDEDHRYTKAIYYVAPNTEVHLVKTDVTTPHKLDSLTELSELYYELVRQYPEDTFYLNLSSGTPQMKMLMFLYSMERQNNIGIQVDSPARNSNIDHPATKNGEDLDIELECNLDNDSDAINRTHQPDVRSIMRFEVGRQLLQSCERFDYDGAYNLYKKYDDILPKDLGPLLKHCRLRSNLKYEEALQVLRKFNGIELRNGYAKELSNLWEFFMVIEMRCEQQLYEEFYVKITPFLYRLLYWFIFNKTRIPFEYVGEYDGKKQTVKIVSDRLKKHMPVAWDTLSHLFNGHIRSKEVTFYIMLQMLVHEPCFNYISTDTKKALQKLRKTESEIRNKLAHDIKPFHAIMNDDMTDMQPNKVKHLLREVFLDLIGKDQVKQKELIYRDINKEIKHLLESML